METGILNIPSIKEEGRILKIDEIVIDSLEFAQSSTLNILGRKIDKNSFIVNVILMVILHVILYYFKVFDDINTNKTFFYMYIFLWFIFAYEIYNASVYSGNVQLELTNLTNINQSISLFLGSVVILIFVLKYLKPNIDLRKYFLILFLLISISLSVTVEQTDRYLLQDARYVKETSLNFIKWLFVVFVVKDFF